VELAHPGDDRLVRLLVDARAEGRVLFREPLERLRQVLLALPVGELDRVVDDGSGTCIDVSVRLTVPSVNVSPERQSMPNSATMSPGAESSMSSIWFECMRTSRPTFSFSVVRTLWMNIAFLSVPWYTRT
jgi:hypothetical protein